MAQNTVNYANNPTGPELLDDYLAKEQENILSSNSGIQRPSYAVAGTVWIDTSTTPWTWKLYDGSSDITIGTFNISTHASNFIHNNGNETINGTKTFSETSSGANLVQSTSRTASGTWVDFVQQINGARRGTMRTMYNSDGSYQVTFGCNGPNAESATGVIVKRTTSTTTVSVPTPATSTNNTEVATTAFVKAQGYARDSGLVHTSGNETIAGTKTFSSTISGSINGNAATVTNGVYTSGNQTIGGTKTFSAVAYGKASSAENSILTTVSCRKGTATGDNANGYFKLGNGMIIQWGNITSTSFQQLTVTLPIAFSNTNYRVVLTQERNNTDTYEANTYVRSKTTSSFNILGQQDSISFIAIGY